MVIKLSQFGNSLGTRRSAADLRNKIISESNVELDFEGVSIVSNSFADELFGIFVKENGFDALLQKVVIKNSNAEVTATIRKAIILRLNTKS